MMAKSEMEKREYSRGYQRGRMRSRAFADFAFRIARAYRKQAIEQRRSFLGKDNWTARECQTCERWNRGGLGAKWGECSAAFVAAAGEPFMWTDEPKSKILTHEDFGCCNHLKDNPLRPTPPIAVKESA